MKHLTAPLVLALIAAACAASPGSGGVPAAPPIPDGPVLVVEFSGGCMMMGPNCQRWVVDGDGTVEVFRVGTDVTPVTTVATDPALVERLWSAATTADPGALRARLPEGRCNGCVDGIDTTFTFTTPGGTATFRSIETELVRSEPLLDAAWAVVEATEPLVEVPTITR